MEWSSVKWSSVKWSGISVLKLYFCLLSHTYILFVINSIDNKQNICLGK